MTTQQSNAQDLEAARSKSDGPTKQFDPDLVTWDGPDDPENPKNWPRRAKWRNTVAVSIFTFISPVSSSMVAPALSQLGADLNMQSDIEVELALSIFILAYAIGPLFFGPASEVYGRMRLLQISNLWYFAWNLGCGFAQNPAQLFAFRFLAGIGGSAPVALGGAAIGDIWTPEERGKAMGIYTLAPILGPVVGPIAGGFIAEYTTWRWVFWSSSAVAVAIQMVGLIWLHESHPATLLNRKRNRLVKQTGNHKLHTGIGPISLSSKFGGALVRPVRLFTTQPIVMVVALYMGYLFGTTYLLLATFPTVWGTQYGESQGIAGLNYISIAIGSFIGLFLNFILIDRIYRRLKEKSSGIGVPEFRMPTMFIGSGMITIGLFWYGWSVQSHIHWIMPNIGVAIFSAGTMGCLQGMQTYIVDSYTTYAASAMAACALLRSLAGFGFPLFAPYMYRDLGYGWGTSVLAFVSIAIGFPAPLLFWHFGAKLRAMSAYASG
ncbi:major facilitator superfamily domain-containing protein [Aspergillus transmontanensis]|uniref:Major facilitator superfamily domain-containing protein n=1 Tax=Aspergillus transmontanensis TaxID=1034304 RepID=A0A5N6VYK5_9EURO|nr:major facilitator superfamily domain-containing protein [Aspergillus transmontanensis]